MSCLFSHLQHGIKSTNLIRWLFGATHNRVMDHDTDGVEMLLVNELPFPRASLGVVEKRPLEKGLLKSQRIHLQVV